MGKDNFYYSVWKFQVIWNSLNTTKYSANTCEWSIRAVLKNKVLDKFSEVGEFIKPIAKAADAFEFAEEAFTYIPLV